MEGDRGSCGDFVHGSTLTTLNVLISLWTLICVGNFLSYFQLCPKTPYSKFLQCLHQLISQTYMDFRNIV